MIQTPSIPPPGTPDSGKPKPKPIKPKPQELQTPSQGADYTYLGFHFANEKDYKTFKDKVLANMARAMMAQIKRDNDNMLKALRKMRELETQ